MKARNLDHLTRSLALTRARAHTFSSVILAQTPARSSFKCVSNISELYLETIKKNKERVESQFELSC